VRGSRILEDSEVVVADSRRHLSGLAFLVFASVALVVSLGYGWSAWHGAPRDLHYAFAYLAGVIALSALGRIVWFRSHHVIVTDERIVFLRGAVRVRADEVLLTEVTGAAREQRLRDRVVVKGSVRVGIRGFDAPLMIREIARPRQLADAINRAVAALAKDDPEPAPAAVEDLHRRLEHLEVLKRRGVITAEEFAEKRSQLGV